MKKLLLVLVLCLAFTASADAVTKRIIILEKQDGGRYKYALWADVPAARQAFYADANKKSAWKDASTADNTALQSGSVVEFVDTAAIDGTLTQVQAALQARWNDYQAAITAANPWNRYGSFWDGATWTAGGVN